MNTPAGPAAARAAELAGIPTRSPGAARLLHTSDWHLGVAVRNVPRSDDHDTVIDEIVAIADAARPDLILHTGDLFDGPRPPMLEFGRAIRALRRLAEVAPVVVLAGNHDSAAALEVLGIAVDDTHGAVVAAGEYNPHAPTEHRIRVHARPVIPEKGSVVTYGTAAGLHLRLAVLPFVHQNRVLTDFASLVEPNATYNDSLRKIIGACTKVVLDDFDPTTQVAVFASHLHIAGAATSSERTIHISDDYATDAAHLDPAYGYLAFGHIHVPQPVAGGRGTYAGSILEVDFGETGDAKRVVLADLEPGRATRITSVALHGGRRLHRIASPLSQLASHAAEVGAGIVEVTIRPEPVTTDPAPAATTAGVDNAEAEPVASTTTSLIVVDGVEFDTLSRAVDTLLPDATVVSLIDGRNPHVVVADQVDAGTASDSIEDSFKAWLVDEGNSLFASDVATGAAPARVVALFDELFAAVTAGETPVPHEVTELERHTRAEAH